jgi:2-dehydropantoate 2-reductase
MKILMFGRGVITTQYGWAFEKAGHEVTFYIRPESVQRYKHEISLKIRDARKKLAGVINEQIWKTKLINDICEQHDYDLIIVSVQHYQFPKAAEYLRKKIGSATVLIFNNFWTDPLQETALFPTEQLAWGFPLAGGGFDADGVLNGAILPEVHFGTFGARPTDRELAVRVLFSKTGFKIKEHSDFKGWLWIHFVIDAGFFSKVLEVGSVEKVFSSNKHLKDVMVRVRELLRLVEKRDIDLSNNLNDIKLYTRPAWTGSLIIRFLMKISPPFRTMVYSHNNPKEAESYGHDVLKTAAELNFKLSCLKSGDKSFKI